MASPMGFGANRTDERAMAMLGMVDCASTYFEDCRGVNNGGVLFALAPLLSVGLLKDLGTYFSIPRGNYYRIDQLFLSLAVCILLRVKNMDQLRYSPVAEWGRLIGLDRLPEKKTMRRKVEAFSGDVAKVEEWNSMLMDLWLKESTEVSGVLYVDGHVRVYHGGEKLPRRYIARQRLCLRGMTDYWCHDADGMPLFVITTPMTDGLLKTLREDIVPRLLRDIPNQPTETELEEDPLLCRFSIAFDREGYSPGFFKEVWESHRIACMTYHKYPKGQWREEEFAETERVDRFGHASKARIAERGSLVGSGTDRLWLREVRRLTESGKQVSLISTMLKPSQAECSTYLADRWTQENFFKYGRAEYAIDSLGSYELEEIPPDKPVVNPQYRRISGEIRGLNSKLNHRILKKEKIKLDESLDQEKTEKALREANLLAEEIASLRESITACKKTQADTPKKLPFKELPEEEQFKMFSKSRHMFMNVMRIIAYRAETALYNTLREHGFGPQSRSIIKDLFNTPADLIVDEENSVLTVRLHHQSANSLAEAARCLADEMNQTETTFPGTELTVNYKVVGENGA